MRRFMCLLGLVAMGVTAGNLTGQDPAPKKNVHPGWPGVFPDLGMYQRTLKQAEVDKDQKNYRQTANYQWTGGRLEDNDVTLARGQKYTKDYTGAALLKNAEPPEMIKVGDFTGWIWKDKKLVVMLGQDRILLVETKFEGNDLVRFTSKFPLKVCAKALDNPPSKGAPRTLASFRQLKKGMSYQAVVDLVGPADKDVGSGIHVMAYRLDDGTRVLLGFPDFKQMIYVKHEDKDGKATDLVK